MSQFYLTALQLSLCLAPMAMGIFISMKVFNIPDITTDGSYTMGAAVTAVMLTHQMPLGLTLAASMGMSAVAGTCTGLIHTKLKIDGLLSGILVMTALYSVNLLVMGRSNIPLIGTESVFSFFHFTEDNALNGLMIAAVITFIIISLLIFLLRSDYGIAMRASGNNPSMSKSMGVNNDSIRIAGLAMANSLTGLSGFLTAQYQGFSDINMGIGIVITGLGSVLIADALRRWLSVNKIGKQLMLVITGAFIFQLVLAFTLSTGVDPNMLKLVTAVFVLLIVALPALGRKLKNES